MSCANIIKEYNKRMGGLDLMDGLIVRYKIIMRTKKWYMRIFYHLLDMTIINSWLLYRKTPQKSEEEDILSLADYRAEIAYYPCHVDCDTGKKRGRPSTEVELQIGAKKKRSATHSIYSAKKFSDRW